MSGRSATVVGAGPAGLAAALAIVRAGGSARVFERRTHVGARFHGDFQGLENWSTEVDVLDELSELGIAPTFEHTPFRECVYFGPRGEQHVCRSERPLWYLVRRGPERGTLDDALYRQASRSGIGIELGHAVDHLPDGGIVAQGPRRVDGIVVGYLFDTDRADSAFGAISDEVAPGGYAYLLVCKGRATLATCIFADYHNDKLYLARTVELFQREVGISLRDARPFGGFGNAALPPTLRRGNLLFAGEAAGLQDALFGFGMRYAMVSGHLAGIAIQSGDLASYERACEERLVPQLRASAVNRYLYIHAGARGRTSLLERLCGAPDPRAWLGRYYRPRWWTPLLYPLARRAARRRQSRDARACKETCDCTYCRCVREASDVRAISE